MKRILLISVMLTVFLGGCSDRVETEVEPIIDVSQFSGLTPEQLTDKLGIYPRWATDEKYTTPSGEEYLLSTLEYEIGGYFTEFVVIDNAVVKMIIYIADMESENNEIVLRKSEDLLELLKITPSENITKVTDRASAIRYTSVSDQIEEVLAVKDNSQIQLINITYDQRYFE